MNQNKITVGQYQEIYPIILEDKWTDLDKLVKAICVITGKTEEEVDGWKLSELNAYKFLFDLKMDEKTRKYIKANGNWYRFEYRVQNMPAARYIEGKTYAADNFVSNIHKIMASCVVPQKKILFWKFDKKYNAADHEKYANDLKEAPIQFVYSAAVFFCKLLTEWIKVFLTYLEKETEAKMTKDQIQVLKEFSQNISDGFTQLYKWPNTNESL